MAKPSLWTRFNNWLFGVKPPLIKPPIVEPPKYTEVVMYGYIIDKNRPQLSPSETTSITFYYKGDISAAELKEYFKARGWYFGGSDSYIGIRKNVSNPSGEIVSNWESRLDKLMAETPQHPRKPYKHHKYVNGKRIY